jgi:hypothetical protein
MEKVYIGFIHFLGSVLRGSYFFYLGLILFVSCASKASNKNEPTVGNDSLNNIVNNDKIIGNHEEDHSKIDTFLVPDIKMQDIDKALVNMDKVRGYLRFEWQKDTLKLELFLQKGKPAKLAYTTFDDGGIASGLGAYYFDSSGKVFANKLYYEDREVTEVFLGQHEVLKYEKKGNLRFLQMNKEAQLYREVTSVKKLDDYMMVLNNYFYTAPQPSKDAWAILKAEKPINLYELPDENSKVISKVNQSLSLKYLGNNRQQSVVGQLTWAWYHVITEKGVEGWVFGHPELISAQDDEND